MYHYVVKVKKIAGFSFSIKLHSCICLYNVLPQSSEMLSQEKCLGAKSEAKELIVRNVII